MSVYSVIASSRTDQMNARGAVSRNVTGQLDVTSAKGRAVQLALATNNAKHTSVERSMSSLSAARSDLLALQETVGQLQLMIQRQLQLATDQLKEFEINGVHKQALTDEYDTISDQRDALVKHLKTNIANIANTPLPVDVTITMHDGSNVKFVVSSLSLAMIHASESLVLGPGDLHRAANGGIQGSEAGPIAAAVGGAPAVGGFNARTINNTKQRVLDARDLDEKVSVELAKRFESYAVALSKIDNALSQAVQFAASLEQNNTDLASAETLRDTELQNTANTSQKAAAHVIAGDMAHEMEQMAILKQD